jgi:hypothetical protein
MSYDQFVDSLDTIAVLFFNHDYDSANPSKDAAGKSVEEKRVMFYKLLRLGSSRHI